MSQPQRPFAALVVMLAMITPAATMVVVEYRFDGNANDTSGHGHHGVVMGGASFVTGRFGQAIQLDGVNDFVDVAIPNYTYTNFTLECWVNRPDFGPNIHYISLYQNAYLVLGDWVSEAISTWADGLSPIAINGGSGITTSVWHHFAFTYDGSIQRVYIDGVEITATPSSGAVTHTPTFNEGLNIGCRYTGSVQFLTGLLDNVRIHDVALARTQLGFFTDGAQVFVRTIDATPTQVAPGQTGIPVSLTVENSGMNAITVTAATLSFRDAAAVDRSTEYTVTPAPGNPTSIAAGATEAFDFTVDVGAGATLGAITIDGSFSGTDSVTMSPALDAGADTPDAWDVVGALARILSVTTAASTVAQGSSGHAVTVAIENPGLNPLLANSVGLTFTGTVDRTTEYTVTEDPGNPTIIPAASTSSFDFTVDVAPGAALEVITLDAAFLGLDTVSGGLVSDPDADVVDQWTVVTCAATLCGDCTGDGAITILDALAAAQHAAAVAVLAGTNFTNCNVLGVIEPAPGAVVDILDALTLAQSAAGLPVVLTCC